VPGQKRCHYQLPCLAHFGTFIYSTRDSTDFCGQSATRIQVRDVAVRIEDAMIRDGVAVRIEDTMIRDEEADDKLWEELDSFYSPIALLKYTVPERVPGLGAEETLDHLDLFYFKHEEFLDQLASDSALIEHFKQGLSTKSPAPVAPAAVVVTAAAASMTAADRMIEEALFNRAEFADRQMVRLMVCEPCIDASLENKKGLLRDAFEELLESLLLLQKWGSNDARSEFESKADTVEEAIEFGELMGVTLFKGELWSEASEPTTAA
jgi:hypothetical protein